MPALSIPPSSLTNRQEPTMPSMTAVAARAGICLRTPERRIRAGQGPKVTQWAAPLSRPRRIVPRSLPPRKHAELRNECPTIAAAFATRSFRHCIPQSLTICLARQTDSWGRTMGSLSIWHWLILIVMAAIYGIPLAKIIRRTGHSRWWVIVFFVPVINLIALWVLAFVRWPTTDLTT